MHYLGSVTIFVKQYMFRFQTQPAFHNFVFFGIPNLEEVLITHCLKLVSDGIVKGLYYINVNMESIKIFCCTFVVHNLETINNHLVQAYFMLLLIVDLGRSWWRERLMFKEAIGTWLYGLARVGNLWQSWLLSLDDRYGLQKFCVVLTSQAI